MSLIRSFDRDFFDHFDHRFNNLVQNWENSLGVQPLSEIAKTSSKGLKQFHPAIDISENEKEVLVHADLPGMPKENVKLEVHGQQLIVSGETNADKNYESNNWNVRERSFGKFERRVTLPKTADVNKINAKLENGVLEVKIAKFPESQLGKKTVQIQ